MDGCKYHLSQFFAQKSQKIYKNGITKHAEMGKKQQKVIDQSSAYLFL